MERMITLLIGAQMAFTAAGLLGLAVMMTGELISLARER